VTYNTGAALDVVIESSNVIMGNALIQALSTPCPGATTGWPALRMTNSDVTLVNCDVNGTAAFPTGPHPPIPGILMNGGRLRVSGTADASIRAGEAYVPVWPPFVYDRVIGPSIEAYGGSIVVDPDVTFWGSPTFTGTATITHEDMPYMRVIHIYQPSVWDIPYEVHAPPGVPAVVAVSLPASPLPTPFGELWLDPRPGAIVPLAMGTIPANGVLSGTSPLHRGWPHGVTSAWQAVLVEPAGIRLSMPALPVFGVY
jgi:hypothetical protein